MILEVDNIITLYGKSLVLNEVSLTLDKGEIVALLGRNGAGKTTTMRSIMGLTPPRSGSIKFMGVEITGKQAFQIANLGIGYVPDDRRIFSDLTAEDNMLLAGRYARKKGDGWTTQKVYQLFPALESLRLNKGGYLSGGEQKMLAWGRALMTNPEMLLLDEPSEGLAPLVVKALIEVAAQIREAGITIFMADQNFMFCRRVANRAYILDKGVICYQDEMEKMWEKKEVISRYLTV
jgi:branched-chain amino acid transport system ATP-binding protein